MGGNGSKTIDLKAKAREVAEELGSGEGCVEGLNRLNTTFPANSLMFPVRKGDYSAKKAGSRRS